MKLKLKSIKDRKIHYLNFVNNLLETIRIRDSIDHKIANFVSENITEHTVNKGVKKGMDKVNVFVKFIAALIIGYLLSFVAGTGVIAATVSGYIVSQLGIKIPESVSNKVEAMTEQLKGKLKDNLGTELANKIEEKGLQKNINKLVESFKLSEEYENLKFNITDPSTWGPNVYNAIYDYVERKVLYSNDYNRVINEYLHNNVPFQGELITELLKKVHPNIKPHITNLVNNIKKQKKEKIRYKLFPMERDYNHLISECKIKINTRQTLSKQVIDLFKYNYGNDTMNYILFLLYWRNLPRPIRIYVYLNYNSLLTKTKKDPFILALKPFIKRLDHELMI